MNVRHIPCTCLVLLLLTTPGTANDVEAFWQAAREGDVARVKQLLESGVDVNAVTEFNCGAMYFAANRNQADVIRALIEAGGDVNLRDTDYHFTPVQMAAWLGHTEATKALMDGGADPSDTIGSCFAAASNGHAETVELIINELEFSQSQLNALWSTANADGHQNVCELLVKLGAKPTATAESTDDQDVDTTDDAVPSTFDFSADRPRPIVRADDWPEFRGRNRSGIADGQHPPIAFELASKTNVLWTRPIEGLGLSSPIICDQKIYLTTAVSELTEQTIDDQGRGWIDAVEEDVPHEWKVICIDLKCGELIWEKTAAVGIPRGRRHWKSSQANPTCATDGRFLIASFGSQGLFCFDLDGNLQWERDLGVLDSGWYIDSTFEWGFASSPIIFEDKVIIQCDVHGDSYVAAFAIDDGQELWKTPREELPSWGTPTIYRGQQTELILNASKAIRSYDPTDGQQLWELRGNSPITVASPVAADNLIVATGGYKTPKPIYVVRPGSHGDITPSSVPEEESEPTSADEISPGDSSSHEDAIVWSQQKGGVYLVTPLMYQGALYLCKKNGVLSCYDPESGELLFEKRMPCGYITASPVAADGRIYFTGEKGDVVVLQAGREYQELAVSSLQESTLASPAISDGMILFRTVKGLIALGHTAE